MVALSVAVFFAVLSIPFAVGVWILRPLDLAARNRRNPTRFTMLDFLGLVFLLQLPMAILHPLLGSIHEADSSLKVLSGFGCVISAFIWWGGVKTFSHAGIDAVRSRGVLVFIVLPVAFYGSFASVIIPAVWWSDWSLGFAALVKLALLEIALIGAIGFSGYYSRWVVKQGSKLAE